VAKEKQGRSGAIVSRGGKKKNKALGRRVPEAKLSKRRPSGKEEWSGIQKKKSVVGGVEMVR